MNNSSFLSAGKLRISPIVIFTILLIVSYLLLENISSEIRSVEATRHDYFGYWTSFFTRRYVLEVSMVAFAFTTIICRCFLKKHRDAIAWVFIVLLLAYAFLVLYIEITGVIHVEDRNLNANKLPFNVNVASSTYG